MLCRKYLFLSKSICFLISAEDSKESVTEKNLEWLLAFNGANIANCNGVVKEAMDRQWTSGGTWHYFRSTNFEKVNSFKEDIKVINRVMSTENNLYFIT